MTRKIVIGTCFSLAVIALVGSLAFEAVAQRRVRTTDDPILIGRVCVPGNNAAERAIDELAKSGGKSIRDAEGDHHCFNPSFPLSIKVPYGLEGWSIALLNRSGVRAGPATGTAGGSGDIRIAFEPTHILAREIAPNTIEYLRSDIQCRLDIVLKANYEDVSFSRCTEPMLRDGFCWWAWLGGHSKTSSGLQSAALSAKISDKYWASAKLQIWMGYFPSSPFEPTLGSKVKAHFYVVSSKYARSPVSAKPDGDAYQAIDHFEKGVSPDELDDILNSRVEAILKALPASCGGRK